METGILLEHLQHCFWNNGTMEDKRQQEAGMGWRRTPQVRAKLGSPTTAVQAQLTSPCSFYSKSF